MVRVSPFHSPVEKPMNVCGAYSGGCGRPSIQIVRHCWYVPMYISIAMSSCVSGLLLLPDPELVRAEEHVRQRVGRALVLEDRVARDVPAVAEQPRGVVDR